MNRRTGTVPQLTCVCMIAVAVLASSCDSRSAGGFDGRQLVFIELPASGVFDGDHDAPVALVEFGSFSCVYCWRFHREYYPEVYTNFVETGRVVYRYVDVNPPGSASIPLAMSECSAAHVGWAAAREWGFAADSAQNETRVLREVADVTKESERTLHDCIDRVAHSEVRKAEYESLTRFGIRSTPLLVVGAFQEGGVAGWVYRGLVPLDTLLTGLRSAEAWLSGDDG